MVFFLCVLCVIPVLYAAPCRHVPLRSIPLDATSNTVPLATNAIMGGDMTGKKKSSCPSGADISHYIHHVDENGNDHICGNRNATGWSEFAFVVTSIFCLFFFVRENPNLLPLLLLVLTGILGCLFYCYVGLPSSESFRNLQLMQFKLLLAGMERRTSFA